MNMEEIVAKLVQKVERRFYGKYRGFVVDNDDPDQLGRLKVTVPSLLGKDVVTGWAFPCTPYGGSADQGFLFIPEKEAGVWIEFEEGDLEFPIWVGTFWSKPRGESELPSEDDKPPQSPPTRKMIKTKKGHTIELEDEDGEEKITIKHKDKSYLAIDKDGSVIVGNKKGSTLILNAKDENLVIVEQHGNAIEMTEDGVTLKEKGGTSAIHLGKDIVRVMAKEIVLEGTSVSLGAGAAEPTVMGNSFNMLWNLFTKHTHIVPVPLLPAGAAPSSPPVPPGLPLMPGKELSSSVIVK